MQTIGASGPGLSEDQQQQLQMLERAGPATLSPWDRGVLAALKRSASPAQTERIDRLAGQRSAEQQPTSPPLRTPEGQQQYRERLGDATARGECPTCGQRMPGGRS